MRSWWWGVIGGVACTAAPPIDDPVGAPSLELAQPWQENELSIEVALEVPGTAAVVCRSQDDLSEAHLVESDTVATAHSLRLAGLLADHVYVCRGQGVEPPTPVATRQLRTVDLSDPRLPTIESETLDPAAGSEYVLTNHSRDCRYNGHRLLVMDRQGQIRWHGTALAGVGPSLDFTWNGDDTFTWGGGWLPHPGGRPRHIDLYGSSRGYDTGPVLGDASDSAFHHDGKRLADGRYLTLEAVEVSDGGEPFEGFRVRRVDPVRGVVDFDYHSQRALDEGHLPGGRGDAWHANWVDIDVIDGREVLLVSLCYLYWVVAIDVETGDWRWAFGRSGDFTIQDLDGSAQPDFQFPECQHGLQYDAGRLLVYDNGWNREYSRAVEYELDESKMVATRRWSWREPDWWETTLGSVDWLPEGRVLVDMGHADCFSSNPGDRTTFVEIDPARGEKLWEARFVEREGMSYRADWADACALFANAAYCPAIAERIRVLGL